MATNSNTTSTTSGVSFLGLLTIAFIVLKLTHVIDWSWWWVLSPILIPIGIVIVILVVMAALIFGPKIFGRNK